MSGQLAKSGERRSSGIILAVPNSGAAATRPDLREPRVKRRLVV